MSLNIIRAIRRWARRRPESVFPLVPPLPLPAGMTEQQLAGFVDSVRIQGSPEAELRAYAARDFRRFAYTLGLAQGITGSCLELGANPYFMTMLLDQFTDLELSLANYFGLDNGGEYAHPVEYTDPRTGERHLRQLPFRHFNVEKDGFPYPDASFDLVVFAEIIEHLLTDPSHALREIRRVLKPGGSLILTTPNVARLENVAKLIAGTGICDPYSGYGPYGRHNREYDRRELERLLRFEGFAPTASFTADVNVNRATGFCSMDDLSDLLRSREHDLGQYIFVKAVALPGAPVTQRPAWLYRSYPEGQLV